MTQQKEKVFDYEFGGPIGVSALMIWSHYILIYFWLENPFLQLKKVFIFCKKNFRYCLETNNGRMVLPLSINALVENLKNVDSLILSKGIPSTTTWIAYFAFFFIQIILAAVMPGLTMYGLPTKPKGEKLPYHCNGYLSYYLCLFLFFFVHFLGIFKMSYIADHFGEILIASIIIGDVTSVFWYVYGVLFANEYNGRSAWSGNVIYDFFMGSILYPRIGEVDIKMIAECRWSWTTLMLLTMSCAYKQYESKGYVTSSMVFMLVAHWLYSNATAKGEHCIPCTWDMFHENFGWMLNFWNISGVPFLYCFQSLYILKNQDSVEASMNVYFLFFIYVLLFVGYYIFDTANSQKAYIKVPIKRDTFPQLPWSVINKNSDKPVRFIKTPNGNILIDGWYAFVRKLQYTGFFFFLQ
jgi:delta24(24(1))-sterol reductase